jgi:hypothetical protein
MISVSCHAYSIYERSSRNHVMAVRTSRILCKKISITAGKLILILGIAQMV